MLPRFTRKTVIVKPGLVEIYSFPIRPQYSHVPRCEIEDLPELHFLLPGLFLGALTFAQIKSEGDALAAAFFKQSGGDQHGYAAAIFPEKLLLIGLDGP